MSVRFSICVDVYRHPIKDRSRLRVCIDVFAAGSSDRRRVPN